MVRRDGQDAGALPLLQGREPRSDGGFRVSGLRLEVDIDRLTSELDLLAAHSDARPPAVTRIVFSDADLAARSLVKKLFAEAGLSVREDALGNTFARWQGQDPNL